MVIERVNRQHSTAIGSLELLPDFFFGRSTRRLTCRRIVDPGSIFRDYAVRHASLPVCAEPLVADNDSMRVRADNAKRENERINIVVRFSSGLTNNKLANAFVPLAMPVVAPP